MRVDRPKDAGRTAGSAAPWCASASRPMRGPWRIATPRGRGRR